VKVRLTAKAANESEADILLSKLEEEIHKRLGENIFGADSDTMESVISVLLVMNKYTIAAAESCTGGLISHRLTNIPGSTGYFERGITAYSNRSKIELLNVKKETLEKFGAVSAETAGEMALNASKIFGTDIGLSVTGIAGPGGGTAQKPVGLVFAAIAGEGKVLTKKFNFSGDRIKIKEQTAQSALDFLRRFLLKNEG
jgi:nicotinamide-nucleotide amidase